MNSISTTRGDAGDTSLAGGVRVSKASLRVEAYGTVDELISALGVARAQCADAVITASTMRIQQELFSVGSALATAPGGERTPRPLDPACVSRLTAEVHALERVEGMLVDWSVPGGDRSAAAYDLARTVCRRAERTVVRLQEARDAVQPEIIAYLNRLSDLLWLFGRKLEVDAGVDGSLRQRTGKAGAPFSPAW